MKDSLTTTRTIVLSGIELEDALTAYFGIPEGEASFTWSTYLALAPDVTITADVTADDPAKTATDDDMIPWTGGPCPVWDNTRVDVLMSDGRMAKDCPAWIFAWEYKLKNTANVVAYRVLS